MPTLPNFNVFKWTRLLSAFVLVMLACSPRVQSQDEPAPAPKKDAAELVKQGRQLFGQARYAEALKAFEQSLDLTPANKETRFLAATAAYWARKPARAMEYWNRLHDKAVRNSNDEWEIEKNRVMTLSALGQLDAADMAADRLREIREAGKSSTAKTAKGFVRENFFGKNMRAGCWESFDERGDAVALWLITVKHEADPPADASAEKTLATLAVEFAALPGGGTGYVFSEETDDASRIYKRWTQRPSYAEVRALALAVLQGSAQPVEEKPRKPPPLSLDADDDEAVPQEIKDMALEPQAQQIVYTAWKLRAVRADVTRLARIQPGDAAALEQYLSELNTQYPRAAANAGELSDLVASAKAENVRTACERLVKLHTRSPYMEFALLTALNTRDRDIPPAALAAFAKSPDFMVRITTALLLGRHAQRHGLDMLFNEIERADARACELLAGTLDELLGHVLDTPPNSKAADAGDKLKDWKSKALAWRAANVATLEFNATAKPGEALWTRK